MLLGAFQRERRDLCTDLQVRGGALRWATGRRGFGLIRGWDLILTDV